MKFPTETEYAQMLGRLQNVMAFAAEELEQLANGAPDNISSRLRDLARVMFRIGNDANDPVPVDLPSIADTPTPNVTSEESVDA